MLWHCLACIWIIIGSFSDDDGNEGWVINEKKKFIPTKEGDAPLVPEASQDFAIWSSAIYFLVTTSTSVGYGDYFATTLYERLYCIAV